jgi:acyl-coenzyme A synthetase/AMP-(fatty) acid ligase
MAATLCAVPQAEALELARGRARERVDEVHAAEIQQHVKATIAPYKYPRRVHFVDALPRTATGKLQRFRLRDRT